jgi:hypothetical protein
MSTNSCIYSEKIMTDSRGKKLRNICGGYLYQPVHCDDDYFMVYVAGIRPALISRAKTQQERNDLVEAKLNNVGEVSRRNNFPIKSSKPEFEGKLTIYVENTEVDKWKRNIFKTTYSFKVVPSDVDSFLSEFKRKHKVKKHYFKY